MTGIAQNNQKCVLFIVVPLVRIQMREKGLKKNMRMNKSRKKTLIHTSTCTNTHTHGYTNINTYRYTYHIYTLFIIQVR